MDPRILNRITVPVSAMAYQGAADLRGILSFDGVSLHLGFQTADALFGLLKSRPKELQLALDSLERIEFRRGWFWLMPFIELECNNFSQLADVPSSESGRLRLRLKFADRARARKLVDVVRFARAEALHEALNVGIEPAPISTTEPAPMAPASAAAETPLRSKDLED